MDNITPKLLLNIWQKGKTLDDAIWEFCDPKYINEYPEKHPEIERKTKKASETLLEGIGDVLTTISKFKMESDEYNSQIITAKNNMQNNLYDKIISGKLIAIGYKNPIKSDFPILIPPHMWPPENTDMGKSSISANGIDFVRVRIIKEAAIKNKKEISLPDKKPHKQAGRPSKKHMINEAFNALDAQNKIDRSDSIQSHYDLIRDTVNTLYTNNTNDSGLSDETIRRAINQHFSKRKTSK